MADMMLLFNNKKSGNCWHVIQFCEKRYSPSVFALQLRLQPELRESILSVMKTMLTRLLLLLIGPGKEEPHVFSIKVVPSLFLIVTWSYLHVEWNSTSNAVNSIATTSPSSTSLLCLFAVSCLDSCQDGLVT